ncbi:hypothetical protein BJ944DRAFT_270260 [Cunninghamella echinulata]|nr:hypothetical protein BJ944DRAFT_270260 [Cunninghamella echinulata]
MIFNKLTLICIFVFLFGLISAQAIESNEAAPASEQFEALDENHNDYAEYIDALDTTPYDPTSLEKRDYYYCKKGYGACQGNYCCPLGGQCCIKRRCCGKGYYCITNKYRSRVACCPNGRTCRAP